MHSDANPGAYIRPAQHSLSQLLCMPYEFQWSVQIMCIFVFSNIQKLGLIKDEELE